MKMTRENIFELITSHCCEIRPGLKTHTFHPSETLEELGADSVDRIDILNMVMESMSLKIARVKVFGAKNIGELADILYEQKQSAGNTHRGL
jgi:polyketide biosynthesis acyl carrier protein